MTGVTGPISPDNAEDDDGDADFDIEDSGSDDDDISSEESSAGSGNPSVPVFLTVIIFSYLNDDQIARKARTIAAVAAIIAAATVTLTMAKTGYRVAVVIKVKEGWIRRRNRISGMHP